MSLATAESTRCIVVERVMPHPPEKIWRALTQSALLEAFLMKNDIEPVVGHKFNFWAKPIAGWNGVSDCEVLVVEPCKRLAWSQCASGEQAANGLRSVVTWTLRAVSGGTLVRMEHSGFRRQDSGAFDAMSSGWPRVVAGLERVAGLAESQG